MERIVRILNQSGLQTRQYMDRKTGDQKVINSVVLKLTDGIDTFLGEITGERAVNWTRSTSIRCSARWWSENGTPSRPARPCRLRRSTWIKLT